MARQDRELEAFEDELVEAWRNLARLPDRERGFLSAGSRSCWPQIVRDRWTDYADAEARPRSNLTRREMRVMNALLVDDGCAMMVVPLDRRQLVAAVLNERVWPVGGGFAWEAVWTALGGKACGATTATLRSRYDTQLRRLAVRFAAITAVDARA